MYNSTNAATWLNSPPCIARRRNSTLRFVCLFIAATWLRSPPRIARRRNSTQGFVCQFIITTRHSFPQHPSLRHRSPRRLSTQRNDLFVTSRLHATSLNPTPRGAFQRKDLLVNLSSHLDDAPRIATNCDLAPLISTQLNDLFVNLSPLRPAYRLTEALLSATPRNDSHCSTTWLLAKQRNELKLN